MPPSDSLDVLITRQSDLEHMLKMINERKTLLANMIKTLDLQSRNLTDSEIQRHKAPLQQMDVMLEAQEGKLNTELNSINTEINRRGATYFKQ